MNWGKVILVGLIIVGLVGAAIMLQPGKQPTAGKEVTAKNLGSIQEVELRALETGFYDNQVIRVKAGMPVRLKFTAEPRSGCGHVLEIPAFGIQEIVRGGETKTVEFTPTQAGEYDYRCSMNMFRGKLIVEGS